VVPNREPHFNTGFKLLTCSSPIGEISGILSVEGITIKAGFDGPAKLSPFSSNPSTIQ